MQRFPKLGICLLAIFLIAAVAQCAVACQTTPIQFAKSDANVPPCHKHSKAKANDCVHPQDALLAATANLLIDWIAAPLDSAILISSANERALASALRLDAVPIPPAPPLCLRV